MKILILSDDFPPQSFGGAGIVAFNLAAGLRKLGHQIYVITAVQDKSMVGRLEYQEMVVFRIYAAFHERWGAYLGLYNPQTVRRVGEIVGQIRPDITHIHNVHRYLSYHCFKIAKKYSKAVFLTAHDAMLFHYGKLVEFINPNELSIPETFDYRVTPWQQIKRFKRRYNPFRNIVIKHYLKYIDRIFAVSRALKDALNQNGIRNVEVVHNGIDAAQWRVDSEKTENFKKKYGLLDKKTVLFAGRLSFLKGRDKIVEVMKVVAGRFPGVVLLTAGVRDNYARRMPAGKDGLSIIATGWIEGDELKSAYRSSDVIVTPSIYLDPFPTVNLEAMACKKSVVGTCFGGTPEIVQNGKTGYTVNFLNVETAAQKIIALLENGDRARRFGEAGYLMVRRNFSLDKQINLLWNKYFKKVR